MFFVVRPARPGQRTRILLRLSTTPITPTTAGAASAFTLQRPGSGCRGSGSPSCSALQPVSELGTTVCPVGGGARLCLISRQLGSRISSRSVEPTNWSSAWATTNTGPLRCATTSSLHRPGRECRLLQRQHLLLAGQYEPEPSTCNSHNNCSTCSSAGSASARARSIRRARCPRARSASPRARGRRGGTRSARACARARGARAPGRRCSGPRHRARDELEPVARAGAAEGGADDDLAPLGRGAGSSSGSARSSTLYACATPPGEPGPW